LKPSGPAFIQVVHIVFGHRQKGDFNKPVWRIFAVLNRVEKEINGTGSPIVNLLGKQLIGVPLSDILEGGHWNLILSNSALPQLYEGCSSELMRPPVNSVRLLLHPSGMGTRIVNFAAWRGHTLHVLRQQLEARADPVIQGLLSEVAGYPVPAGSEAPDNFNSSQRLATPLRISTRFGTVSFLNSVTVFGTASDVTLSELAVRNVVPGRQ
jgi:MmyB-like transcription regulator ligand binding domain